MFSSEVNVQVLRAVATLFYFSLVCTFSLFAQGTSSCTNSDFELNNFSNWNAEIGTCCPINTSPSPVISGRHTIMTGSGVDPYSLGQIPVVCPGGVYSARLGNDDVNSQAEKLKFTFNVTSSTDLFIYRYAVVLEDPSHAAADQPRFQISVVNQNNQPVTCGSYNVVSGANISGFYNNGDYRLKNWTTVGIELSSYIGQTVTIIFATGDCALGGHFGYAYIDCYCSPLLISNDLCPGANVVNLTAPIGFASYLWSNGQTTSSINISNPVLGTTYSVTMTSVTGCVVTLSTAITPTYAIANFNMASVCSNDALFIDSSYSSSGAAITSRHWDFGDGQTSSSSDPLHAYANPGSYPVKLIVENSIGCFDTITRAIQIQPVPDAAYTPVNVCTGDPLFLYDQSVIATGQINQWSWDFGDQTIPDTSQNPLHHFNSPGIYNTSLVATGDFGCTDTVTHTIQVFPAPTAMFSASEVCLNDPVIFTDQSVSNAGFLTEWHWNFGDHITSSVQNPVHTYSSAVPYDVALVVVSINGCTDTVMSRVSVHPLPNAYFNHSSVCMDDTMRFFDLSSVTQDSLVNREWQFGDGSVPSNLANPLHRYSNPGGYDVLLKSETDFGCINATSQVVQVYTNPYADFTADVTIGCEPLMVKLTDLTTVSDGNISASYWNFGDASTVSQLHHPDHIFTEPGNYDVSLTSVSSNGCRDSITKTFFITVHPKPEAGFDILTDHPSMLNPTVNLMDHFTGVTAWTYFFGDGAYSSDKNPAHIYSAPGDYQLIQVVQNEFQCYDTLIKPIHVEEDYALFVPASFTPNNDGINDFFNAQGFEILSFTMVIFNRWGNEVFQTDDINKAWDGTWNGKPAETGVYVYTIAATDALHQQHERMGNVALIR